MKLTITSISSADWRGWEIKNKEKGRRVRETKQDKKRQTKEEGERNTNSKKIQLNTRHSVKVWALK